MKVKARMIASQGLCRYQYQYQVARTATTSTSRLPPASTGGKKGGEGLRALVVSWVWERWSTFSISELYRYTHTPDPHTPPEGVMVKRVHERERTREEVERVGGGEPPGRPRARRKGRNLEWWC